MAVVEIAARVHYLPLSFANVYFVGHPGGGWTLVDTSLASDAGKIRQAAEAVYGGERPSAIVLTHGHPDHSGSALELSKFWDVPILTHALELPYLTGRSRYPPFDPTVGGFMAMLGRVVRPEPVHLGDRVRAFGSELGDESLPGWKFVFTPGHSPGHLAFFRAEDEILLAGDAVTTMNLDSFWAVLTKTRRVTRPPAPVTCDWPAAAESVRRLADLQPATIAAGHGVPMSGDRAVLELAELATDFPFLPRGRYAKEPAVACETGVVSLPPKPHDSLVGTVAGLGIAAAAGAMFAIAERRRRTKADTQTQAS